MELTDSQRERYARNLLVDGFTPKMQRRLLSAKVFVVGCGGLGSPLLSYLASSGVGQIALCDGDIVSESNLQRQILYSESDLGLSKAEIATERLKRLRGDLIVETHNLMFTEENGASLADGYDIIVDCSDNYECRYAIDSVAEQLDIPFIYGTAEQLSGQVALLHGGGYRKLYPTATKSDYTPGIVAPMAGVVGSLQAIEVIKFITNIAPTLEERLLTISGVDYKISKFKI